VHTGIEGYTLPPESLQAASYLFVLLYYTNTPAFFSQYSSTCHSPQAAAYYYYIIFAVTAHATATQIKLLAEIKYNWYPLKTKKPVRMNVLVLQNLTNYKKATNCYYRFLVIVMLFLITLPGFAFAYLADAKRPVALLRYTVCLWVTVLLFLAIKIGFSCYPNVN
jgi:hypothetical protein